MGFPYCCFQYITLPYQPRKKQYHSKVMNKLITGIAVTTILVVGIVTLSSFEEEEKMKYAIAIHGGAGYITKENISEVKAEEYRGKLNEALDAGEKVLKEGGKAIDAVTAAIQVMENSPLFNAGKGAVFTYDEKNELDASIMDGKTKNAGAVAGVTMIKNPILGAKAVMEKSKHVMLTGDGGNDFAKSVGLEMVSPSYFKIEERLKRVKEIKKEKKKDMELDHSKSSGKAYGNDDKFGTVGCVALDQNGNLAAGTSTGGMTNKRWNRIGDSPVIGAGTYASNQSCAISCTGHGEYFIRSVAAYDVCARMELQGKKLNEAAQETLDNIKKLGGEGGLIGLDNHGNYSLIFNTPGMFRGYRNANGKSEVALFGKK